MARIDWSQAQNDLNDLLVSCVGYNFGPRPADRIEDIRKARAAYGAEIASKLGVGGNDVVLDLGSGCGFATKAIVPLASRVVCADVNLSFLDFCMGELQQFGNVGFQLIEYGDLSVLKGAGITKVISTAVFIHFNFYDICIHLEQIGNVMARGGLLFFDFLNPIGIESADAGLFHDHKKIYMDNPESIAKLVQYNSSEAIDCAARLFGYKLEEISVMHKECFGAVLRKT